MDVVGVMAAYLPELCVCVCVCVYCTVPLWTVQCTHTRTHTHTHTHHGINPILYLHYICFLYTSCCFGVNLILNQAPNLSNYSKYAQKWSQCVLITTQNTYVFVVCTDHHRAQKWSLFVLIITQSTEMIVDCTDHHTENRNDRCF